MATITQVTEALQKVVGERLEELARDSGFIKRKVVVSGSGFVEALVMAFQSKRTASYSEISQAATSLGMPMSSQGMEQRLNEDAARFMKSVLEYALQEKISGVQQSAFVVLEKFNGVYLRDSSTIGLPSVLKSIWKGNGNASGETAALKLQVSWEYSRGALDGITLQDGYCQDKTSPYQNMELPRSALHLADLGYFSLEKLAQDHRRGVFWITRWKFRTLLWTESFDPIELASFLSHSALTELDVPVWVGGKQQVRCRLVACRVPQEVADRRRQRIYEQYRIKGRHPSPTLLRLADWTIVLTNVPTEMLSGREVLLLLKVRWQIELLFKLWKHYLSVDKWNSNNPWRILTEIYAKLITALIFHWTTLSDLWNYPNRSLFKAALIFQKFVAILLLNLDNAQFLQSTLKRLNDCYAKSCRINKRANRACTFQKLLEPVSSSLC
jgi:Transposase DDE domain